MRILKTILILGTYFLPQLALAEYKAPDDVRYWKYYNWYVNHAIVNLVVSGNDYSHLNAALDNLPKLKKKNILIGDVVVIGIPRNDNYLKTENLIKTYDLTNPNLVGSADLTEKYKINNSPTWIVRYQGQDYVYEGLKNPQSLFTSEGVFKDAK